MAKEAKDVSSPEPIKEIKSMVIIHTTKIDEYNAALKKARWGIYKTLTIRQFSEAREVKYETVRGWVKRGKLPATKNTTTPVPYYEIDAKWLIDFDPGKPGRPKKGKTSD